ncbi:MAG: penicillin-binding protein 1C [Elusimicrobia bacterium]|nr:penicillin-binding protein 1C [Elusimicrobiota bacterium]
MKRIAGAVLFFAVSAAAAAGPSVEITDRYGRSLRTVLSLGDTVNKPVPLEAVSPWLVLATLAAEDRRFFTHLGVDFEALARALWQNAKAGRTVSGGSTISEQLVRALNPRPRNFGGKLAEAFQAFAMERRLDKKTILEGYLNNVSYGGRLRGVEAAAWSYFGVPAKDLSLGQAALLAGIPKSPRRYDPRRHLDQALTRQKRVLGRMRDWGWLDSGALALASAERIQVQAEDRRLRAAHFTEFVRGRSDSRVLRTTLDAELQERLEKILAEHLERLARYRVSNGALVALDNASGEVLAWVGSADYFDAEHQGAVDGVTALRQPGSALKPFAYGLALARGLKASDILQDTPAYFAGGFTPKNYDETFHGPVRAREALACSYNIPAARVAAALGVVRLLEGLRRFGLESLRESADHYGLGLVLGNGEVTLLELTDAYAALARGGVWLPWTVLRGEPKAMPAHRALDRESCYIVTDILSDNSARASAFGLNSPFHVPFPFAAKTGTTKDYRDNWALGYTPGWTVGVWVGNFDGKPMRRVSGISGAGPILHDAAEEMERRFGARPFPKPAGIREAEVCPDSGDLPGLWCPSRMREVFSVRNLPHKVCKRHRPPQPGAAAAQARLAVDFPKPGDVFRLDPTAAPASQAIRLRASGADDSSVWTVDGRELPERGASVWWRLREGKHRLSVALRRNGRLSRSASVGFSVVP